MNQWNIGTALPQQTLLGRLLRNIGTQPNCLRLNFMNQQTIIIKNKNLCFAGFPIKLEGPKGTHTLVRLSTKWIEIFVRSGFSESQILNPEYLFGHFGGDLYCKACGSYVLESTDKHLNKHRR